MSDMDRTPAETRAAPHSGAASRTAMAAGPLTLRVVVRDADGLLVDRRYAVEGEWKTRVMTAGGVTLPPAAGNPAFGDRESILYRTPAGEVCLLQDRGDGPMSLHALNLGHLTRAPAAAGDPAATGFYGSHVAYRCQEGGLWHVWFERGWEFEQLNLGGRTWAPAAAADPVLLDYRDQLHVTYVAMDGDLYDLWFDGRWRDQRLNLGGNTQAPAATGVPAAYVFRDQQHVTYTAPNGELWDAWYDGGWHSQLLNLDGRTDCPAAFGNPTGIAFLDHQHVIVRIENGLLCDIRFGDDGWSATPANGPDIAGPAGRDPTSAEYLGELHVTYGDAKGDVWDVHKRNGLWHGHRLPAAPANPASVKTPQS